MFQALVEIIPAEDTRMPPSRPRVARSVFEGSARLTIKHRMALEAEARGLAGFSGTAKQISYSESGNSVRVELLTRTGGAT
jgi:hypothetical protein